MKNENIITIAITGSIILSNATIAMAMSEGVITATSLNVRTGPSTSNAVVFKVSKNTKVTILESKNGWCKIKYNNKEGWCSGDYIKINNSNTEQGSDSQTKQTTANVNLRSGAGTNHGIMLAIPKGKTVKVLSASNGWDKVEYSGKIGYVSSTYLRTLTPTTVTKPPTAVTKPPTTNPPTSNTTQKETTTNVNMRRGVGTSYGVVLTIPKGKTVKVLSTSNGWDKVEYSGKTGYVSNTYLKAYATSTPPPSTTNPSTETNSLKIEYKLADGKDSIEIASNKNVEYKSFFLSSPSRLVIDFKDTQLTSNISDQNINKSAIKKYRASSNSQEKTSRLVIEFKEDFKKDNIKLSKSGNIITVLFNEPSNIQNPPTVNDPQISYRVLDLTLDKYVENQKGRPAVISNGSQFTAALSTDVKKYANPLMDTLENRNFKFQFLKLDEFRNVNVTKLDEHLSNLYIQSGKTNIFKNKGQVFVNSAKKMNIDPLYFVAHTILETGNGISVLAQGNEVELDLNGNAVRYQHKNTEGYLCYYVSGIITPDKGTLSSEQKKNPVMFVKLKDQNTPTATKTVKVYNLFGIGAVDELSVQGGTTRAYDEGWTSIDKSIEGGAKWISDGYINSSKHTHQNTLYFMRWDYLNNWHQYSTDIAWAVKIGTNINKLSYMYSNGNNDLKFIVPRYK